MKFIVFTTYGAYILEANDFESAAFKAEQRSGSSLLGIIKMTEEVE